MEPLKLEWVDILRDLKQDWCGCNAEMEEDGCTRWNAEDGRAF